MLQNATTLLNSQDLLNLWNASVYMHIYYLLEKQTAVQQPALSMVKTNSSATSFNMKNCSIEQKSLDKKGSRAKKSRCKKLQRIRNEKCTMCAWDHWNNIGANQMRYHNEFATSKMPQIRVMCVMTLTPSNKTFQVSYKYQ